MQSMLLSTTPVNRKTGGMLEAYSHLLSWSLSLGRAFHMSLLLHDSLLELDTMNCGTQCKINRLKLLVIKRLSQALQPSKLAGPTSLFLSVCSQVIWDALDGEVRGSYDKDSSGKIPLQRLSHSPARSTNILWANDRIPKASPNPKASLKMPSVRH